LGTRPTVGTSFTIGYTHITVATERDTKGTGNEKLKLHIGGFVYLTNLIEV
jgi:hypothetical protein